MVTPGPGVLSLAGVGAAFGWRIGFYYLIGLVKRKVSTGLIISILGLKNFFLVFMALKKCFYLYHYHIYLIWHGV